MTTSRSPRILTHPTVGTERRRQAHPSERSHGGALMRSWGAAGGTKLCCQPHTPRLPNLTSTARAAGVRPNACKVCHARAPGALRAGRAAVPIGDTISSCTQARRVYTCMRIACSPCASRALMCTRVLHRLHREHNNRVLVTVACATSRTRGRSPPAHIWHAPRCAPSRPARACTSCACACSFAAASTTPFCCGIPRPRSTTRFHNAAPQKSPFHAIPQRRPTASLFPQLRWPRPGPAAAKSRQPVAVDVAELDRHAGVARPLPQVRELIHLH